MNSRPPRPLVDRAAIAAHALYVRTTDVTGNIKAFTADDGTDVEMVMPGDRIKMTAELISAIAIEAGMRFAIREGGRTIGAGVVSKILT